MLLAGTDDGLYELTPDDGDATTRLVLDAGSVMRVRQFDALDGVFAATDTGLYHSHDGDDWTALDVPREKVYSVGVDAEGTVYAGTRPAHLYAADGNDGLGELSWRELDGLQDVPSREDWRLPRHENLAQVRDVHAPADAPDRVVVGVEVGGVHVSDDGGDTWTERRGASATDEDGDASPAERSDGVHDDVHELAVLDPDEYVAATGFGLFRTTDAGQSWTRLDHGYDQRYFRSVARVDGDVYAGGALAHTSTWLEPDSDPELFAVRDDTIEPVHHPRPDETVTGIESLDGDLVAATHCGTVMRRTRGDWTVLGSLPVPDGHAVSYTPVLSFDE
ncbi:MAG: WD40/YVTN/BNR-like repeat-containing protein [Halobacterium sp.]